METHAHDDIAAIQFDLLIDGDLVTGDRTLDVIDPSTGGTLATGACASEAQLERAVAAAAKAFPGWAATTIAERQRVLSAMADAIDANAETLARIVTSEQGKPIGDARAEVGGLSYFMRYYAALDLPVDLHEDGDNRRVEIHRAPLGVVAAITPWNFPILIGGNKIAAAMLAGNCVVLKPAPSTPLSALYLGMLVRDVVPAGVLNVLADRNDLGERLTHHPLVRKISFTGSTTTGARVMQAASSTIKRVTLELGGNDAGIVLDDCDPATVAPKLFGAAFMNNGQVCVAMKRVYVADSQYDAICDAMADLARAAVVGPGLQQGTQLGPVQNRQQFDKLKSLIEETRGAGTIIAGGDSPEGDGYFINPTIVRDIADDARLVTDEQFGPVLPILRYSNLDDAIARANDTSFGLGNSVWSADPARAGAVAARLDSGTVWINQHGDITPVTPFAGAKMSGLGVEFGQDGLREFTQTKVVNYAKTSHVVPVAEGVA